MKNVNEVKFELRSNLKSGESIPEDYYGNSFGYSSKNVSPLLEWDHIPEGTKSFAITVFDQDAPTDSGFWHYVLFDIPANVRKIALGDLSAGRIPEGAIESMTDAGKPGYLGPCTPAGREHHYVYTVHALKTDKLGVSPASTPAFVSFNLWANLLGKASFTVKAGKK